MFCIGITNTYTMAVPLQPLKGLGADKIAARNTIFGSRIFRISTEVPSL